MQDATAAMAPFDLRYDYVSGGLFDGAAPCASCATGCTTGGGAHTCASSGSGCAWWGCWQYDQDPPGAFVRSFASTCAKASPAQIPMISYYQILQSSGVQEGSAEVTSAATNQTFMARYFADWRFLMQQIGQGVAVVHIEPDFWGYAQQYATTHGEDFAWVKALTEALGKPALYWQTPLGNASQNNTTNHWKDNRVDYFFAHMSELAGAHAIGAAFGAGAGDQTTPESDGGNFVTKAKAYFSSAGGGQRICP